jgi:hypothetical protein
MDRQHAQVHGGPEQCGTEAVASHGRHVTQRCLRLADEGERVEGTKARPVQGAPKLGRQRRGGAMVTERV